MRTTVITPDDINEEALRMPPGSSTSGIIRDAVICRLDQLRHEAMVREMEAGYRAEAEDPSPEPGAEIGKRRPAVILQDDLANQSSTTVTITPFGWSARPGRAAVPR